MKRVSGLVRGVVVGVLVDGGVVEDEGGVDIVADGVAVLNVVSIISLSSSNTSRTSTSRTASSSSS